MANTPETFDRHDPGVRGIPARKRAAFALYSVFGIALITIAIATSNIVLAGVGLICLLIALVALRSFPVDRDW